MADNISVTQGSGTTLATRETGGVHTTKHYIADGDLVALGATADAVAPTDTGTFSVVSLLKRLLTKVNTADVTVTSAPTTAVTGTFWQATQPVTAPTLTKGTQSANGFSVQNLTDAGRTYITLNADAVAGVIANTSVTVARNVGGTVTAGQTSYTVTNGKTFRIQSITLSLRSAAAAIAWLRVYLRSNNVGATIATSPIVWSQEINSNSAVLGTGATATITFPDGLEIPGDGTRSIGLSMIGQAITNIVSITLAGFEY